MAKDKDKHTQEHTQEHRDPEDETQPSETVETSAVVVASPAELDDPSAMDRVAGTPTTDIVDDRKLVVAPPAREVDESDPHARRALELGLIELEGTVTVRYRGPEAAVQLDNTVFTKGRAVEVSADVARKLLLSAAFERLINATS